MSDDPVLSSDALSPYIRAVQTADSALLLIRAVRELAQKRSPQAIPTLIEVLGFNNPGAAIAAVEGLVALGQVAADALLSQLDDYNYTARAWAIRAIAQLGDPRGLSLLIETAKGDFSLSVRRAAAKGLGTLQWDHLDPSDRSIAQSQALDALKITQSDPEWVVRYAVMSGLESLGQFAAQRVIFEEVQHSLATAEHMDPDPVVQVRAKWARLQLMKADSNLN